MSTFDLDPETDTPRKDPMSPALKKRHTKALDGFRASASYFTSQRKREVDDLKFVDFDEQWDPTVKTQRAGNQAVSGSSGTAQPPSPPRPTIVVNQLRGPIQQVANTRRAARLTLEFAPAGPGSTDELAEIYEDIVRARQQESRANIARNWAADRAEKAGTGWYRIDTEYAETGDGTDPMAWNDQEIVWRRILNQASVFPDPHAQEPDFSDGRRWYVTEDLPIEVYRERFPDSDVAAYSSSELTAIGDQLPKWIFTSADTTDGEASQTVRIAEVWEVEERTHTRLMLTDGTGAYEDELKPDQVPMAGSAARKRKETTRVIWWSLINGVEYLEEPREWDGAYVPLIPCVGQEANVDGERRWTGIVRPGRDAQMASNVLKAARLEAIALGAKAPYIGFMETIEPYLEWWKNSSIRNYFILPIKAAYDKAGNLLPAPKRQVDEPAIQAITIADQSAQQDIHTVTGVPPVALGELDPHDRSGKAIQALQGQAEVGSSGYMANLVDISLAYEGKVVRDLLPRVYDRPGRIVPAVGIDEKRRLVMLNLPYVDGPDGMPHPLQGWKEGQPVPDSIPGPPGPDGQPMPLQVKYYNLKAGQLSVAATAGKSYATRRKEAADAISNVMQVIPPEMAAAIAPAWLEEQDFPTAKKIAEIAKNALPPNLKAAYEDEKQQGQAQIQQLQQQLQQLQQQLESKVAEKQAEVQAQGQIDLQKAQMDNDTKVKIAQINQEGAFAVADLKATIEAANTAIAAMQEERLAFEASRKEAASQVHQALHEATQNAADRAHEVGMAALEHQHALEQTAQAAALAPAPDQTDQTQP